MAHTSKTARTQITKLLNMSGLAGSIRVSKRKELEKMTATEIAAVYKAARQQVAAQAQVARQQADKPPAADKRATRKTKKLPEPLKKRAQRLARAIKSGKIKAKSGKKSPADYKGTVRERYDKFVALYKGVRIPKRATGAAKTPSVKDLYAAIKAKGKKPYYLSSGYHVASFDVGGGKRGPGVVRAIPGLGATPFSSLTAAEKRAVIKFLNSSSGKILRSAGAPKSASLAEMERVAAQKAEQRAQKGKRGTRNR